jgi:hypothetical protein
MNQLQGSQTLKLAGLFAALTIAVVAVVACDSSSTSPVGHVGMQLVRLEVQHGGAVAFATLFDAPDNEQPAQLWDRAASEPFSVADGNFSGVTPDAKDPLRAHLKGKVTVRLIHVDRELSSALLEGLDLIRTTEKDAKWFFPAAEVARVKKIAGL